MCVHAHVREQELKDRHTVTLTNDIKEPVLLLRPWSTWLHKIRCEKLVENERKGADLDDGDGDKIDSSRGGNDECRRQQQQQRQRS